MSGKETILENFVKRVLNAGKALCRIVVLVMDVDISVLDSFLDIFGKKALVNERLC